MHSQKLQPRILDSPMTTGASLLVASRLDLSVAFTVRFVVCAVASELTWLNRKNIPSRSR